MKGVRMDNTLNYINKNKLSENLLRTHCVSVRLNNEELHLLNTKTPSVAKQARGNGFD